MKFLKKYGIIILAVGILGGILYLNRFSSLAKTQKGEKLYKENCGNCHGGKGEGLRKLIPPLAGTDYVPTHFEQVPCIIRYGIKGNITVNGQLYNQPMPGLPALEADEIKAIMDYMVSEWYPEMQKTSHRKVADKLANCTE